jgi:hypothetical protein
LLFAFERERLVRLAHVRSVGHARGEAAHDLVQLSSAPSRVQRAQDQLSFVNWVVGHVLLAGDEFLGALSQ